MNENRKIIRVLIAVCALFFIIIGYLTYLQLFEGRELMTNTYNRRQYEVEENTIRGSIFDRYGVVLTKSNKQGEEQERVYTYGPLYSQVIGYNSKVYGKSLLEASYNNYLLGMDKYSQVFGIVNRPGHKEKKGNSIYLTIDHKLQALGAKLLKGKKGAVVAIDPNTGEVLALVSKPDFDPGSTELSKNWRSMVDSRDYPFLPRATQGLYAPGSVFKVITTVGAMENGLHALTFEDNGTVVIDGKKIRNSGGKAYGNIDIKKALAVSSNVVYAQLGVKLGSKSLMQLADRFGMERYIPFDIPVNRSIFPYDNMSQNDMAAAAIGQGKILVTPLHMAMLASCIANEGIMMRPALVKNIISPEGKIIESMEPEKLYQVMQADAAGETKKMMLEAVAKGTGKNAAIKGVGVAGKTGTAENELSVKHKNKEHAWFIGFAPVEDPKIAVAVLVEYGGSGGEAAAPIAQKIISEYLSK